jgi:hypothetical protein
MVGRGHPCPFNGCGEKQGKLRPSASWKLFDLAAQGQSPRHRSGSAPHLVFAHADKAPFVSARLGTIVGGRTPLGAHHSNCRLGLPKAKVCNSTPLGAERPCWNRHCWPQNLRAPPPGHPCTSKSPGSAGCRGAGRPAASRRPPRREPFTPFSSARHAARRRRHRHRHHRHRRPGVGPGCAK